jgi:hypothetical protein
MHRPEELKPAEEIHGDRRGDRRYEIALDLRWKLVRRRRVLDSGVGSTLDLSSGGILFEAGRQLPVGMTGELAIAWPVLLHNVAPMLLIVHGRIVRTNGTRMALHMSQHEFRTAEAAQDRRSPVSLRPPLTLLHSSSPAKFETVQ